MANVKIGNLSGELAKQFKIYSNEIADEVNAKSLELAKSAVKKLKETSPKDTGFYSKAWKIKTKTYVYRKNQVHTIHNTTRHSHLLEKGHALRGGGRAKAKPHIAPVEKEIIEEFVDAVEQIIKSGGT